MIAAALAAAAPQAFAKAGVLDRDFGKGGKVVGPPDSLVDMAKLRDGRFIVTDELTLNGYLPNGRPDRRFGDNGRVRPFASGRRVVIGDIAVDDRGRIVLAGTAERTAATSGLDDAASYAAIERYLPNGQPDPTFGNEGAVITDFGLPAPIRPTGIPAYAEVSLPINVKATGVAVDSRERIVVTGTRATTYEPIKTGTYEPRYEAFVVRLTRGGIQDSTFDGNGAAQMEGMTSIYRPALDHRDGIYFTASPKATTYDDEEGPPTAVVGHLKADGAIDPGFGNAGWKTFGKRFGSDRDQPVTLDRKGRLLFIVGTQIERLEPDGSRDRSFGRGGVITVKSRAGEVTLEGITAGRTGILATGALQSQLRASRGEEAQSLLFARLTGDGHLDRHFGLGGLVETRFGQNSNAEGQAVLLDGATVLVGGTASYGPRRPSRIVLARYLLGR